VHHCTLPEVGCRTRPAGDEQALTTIEETAEGVTALMDKYSPGEVLEHSREEVFLQPFEEAITKGEDIDTIITKTAKEMKE